MSTLQIQVPDDVAIRFRQLPENRKQLFAILLADFLRGNLDVLTFMNYLSDRAAERGLTEEKLQELLAEA